MSAEDDGPYSTGYRKPPIANRFVAGRSGNPKGRPKGAKNMLTVLQNELDAKMVVTENGRRKSVSKGQIIAKQLVNKAAGGDLKAIPMVLAHALAHQQREAKASMAQQTLSQADEISMESIMARMHTMRASVFDGTKVTLIEAEKKEDS